MTIKILLVTGLIAVCVGCSSKTKMNADIEQRDLFDRRLSLEHNKMN
jgi:uncharacterized protein YcfL